MLRRRLRRTDTADGRAATRRAGVTPVTAYQSITSREQHVDAEMLCTVDCKMG
jgi:hypothetical protein